MQDDDDDDDDDEDSESVRLWDWPSIRWLLHHFHSTVVGFGSFLRSAFVNNYGLKTSIMRS